MNVTVNKKKVDLPDGTSVDQFAKLQNLPDKGVAVAVNNNMIPRAEWAKTLLRADDDIVVIKAVCGG